MGYSFKISNKVFYMYHPTDRKAHTMSFVTPVVEYWLEWPLKVLKQGCFGVFFGEVLLFFYYLFFVCLFICLYIYLLLCLFNCLFKIYFLFLFHQQDAYTTRLHLFQQILLHYTTFSYKNWYKYCKSVLLRMILTQSIQFIMLKILK